MSIKNEQDLKVIERIFLDYLNELSKTESEIKCSSLSQNKKNKLIKRLNENKKVALDIYCKIDKWFKGESVKFTQKERPLMYRILFVVNGKIAEARHVFTTYDDQDFEIWYKELTDKMERNEKALNAFTEQYYLN